MRAYLIICALIFSCQASSDSACSDKFYEALTKDMGGNSTFVVLNVKVNGIEKKMSIPNFRLFSLLQSKRSLDESEYRKLIQNAIEKKEPIELPNMEILSKYTVEPDESIKADYLRGLAFFKDKYFANGVQKKNVVITNASYVSSLLFENCILSRIDDYTGFMVIDEQFVRSN